MRPSNRVAVELSGAIHPLADVSLQNKLPVVGLQNTWDPGLGKLAENHLPGCLSKFKGIINYRRRGDALPAFFKPHAT